MTVSRYDGDSAPGVVHDALADRAEHGACAHVPTVPPDDEQVLFISRCNQSGDRIPADHVGMYGHIGVLLPPTGQRLRQSRSRIMLC